MEKILLQVINRCSIFRIEEDDSLLFEKVDVIVFHWIPKKNRLYINEGVVDSIRMKYPEYDEDDLREYLKNQIGITLGFSVDELLYMNDDFNKNE
jgi:hypothetical protein